MNVTLGGLTFVAGGGAATYTIESDGLKGWLDGVDSRRESIPRPAAHGDFDVPTYLTGRIVSISGLIHATSDSAYENAILALTGLLADGSSSEMSVEQATGTLTAMVRRHGAPDIQVLVYGETARYRIQLWAADPRRYGDTEVFGPDTSVGASQGGNFPASPVLKIYGTAAGGYTITGPSSKQIVVTQALVDGAPHRIELASGAFFVNGARVLGGVSVYEPWTVPASGFVTASVSDGELTIDVTDTFI